MARTFPASQAPVGTLDEIFLWTDNVPGSEGKQGKEKISIKGKYRLLSNIHNPSVTPFIPVQAVATGAAVIIAPGGGHCELWMDHEGYGPAHWLSEHGIAAFVLKYRLARDVNSTYSVRQHALADIQRAIRLVRSRSKEWGINNSAIGVMGFSAGGELAALAAIHFDNGRENPADEIDRQSSYPDFQALIYPADIDGFEISKNQPPVFLLGGYQDDPEISEGLTELYLKYKKAGVPAELHIYANADHGFGIQQSNTGAVALWPERFQQWLSDGGFLKNK